MKKTIFKLAFAIGYTLHLCGGKNVEKKEAAKQGGSSIAEKGEGRSRIAETNEPGRSNESPQQTI